VSSDHFTSGVSFCRHSMATPVPGGSIVLDVNSGSAIAFVKANPQ
jgi:hypothetical protein